MSYKGKNRERSENIFHDIYEQPIAETHKSRAHHMRQEWEGSVVFWALLNRRNFSCGATCLELEKGTAETHDSHYHLQPFRQDTEIIGRTFILIVILQL